MMLHLQLMHLQQLHSQFTFLFIFVKNFFCFFLIFIFMQQQERREDQTIKRQNNYLNLLDCEGVKTAIRLEKACIEWEGYDRKYGVLGQYRNLLAREGCLVSVQNDSKPKKTASTTTSKNYLEESIKAVKDDLNYRGDLKASTM